MKTATRERGGDSGTTKRRIQRGADDDDDAEADGCEQHPATVEEGTT